MQVPSIDLEIKPVEGKSLNQTQNSFAKECVDSIRCLVLKQKGDHGILENQGDECIRSFRFMFNIDSWEEVEPLQVFSE